MPTLPRPPLTPDARIGADWSVNDTLLRYPAATGVFNAFGIDACCGGAATLAQAAQDADIALDTLLAALDGIAHDDTVGDA